MMDCEKEKESAEVLIGGEKVEGASASNPGNFTSELASLDGVHSPKCPTSESISLNDINSPNYELLDHDESEYIDDYIDDMSDFDDNDEYLYQDDYLTMQAQFDKMDLPAGVEISLHWLEDPVSSENMTSTSNKSVIIDHSEGKMKASMVGLANAEGKITNSSIGVSELLTAPESSTKSLAESSSASKGEASKAAQKSQCCKQFDIVDDHTDHHYQDFIEQQPKSWTKRVQEEWSILDKGLPDTIFVRAYETRMDLLRAIIIGPSGTPYHDGLFVFDCFFPCNYPHEPPRVHYYSGGQRLNPNLYACGKVCLSLLGTWGGEQTEKWISGQSTMLQVLVSIQALILNANPFFNEPGFESSYVGEEGGRRSKQYNEDALIKSMKTMVYILRKPPKHFEEFVADHFRKRGRDILIACKAYAEGATVGDVLVKDEPQSVESTEKSDSETFRRTVSKMMNLLVVNFVKNGSMDCDEFVTPRT